MRSASVVLLLHKRDKYKEILARFADPPEVPSFECPHLAPDHGDGVEARLALVRRIAAAAAHVRTGSCVPAETNQASSRPEPIIGIAKLRHSNFNHSH